MSVEAQPVPAQPPAPSGEPLVKIGAVPRSVERLGAQTIVHSAIEGQNFTCVFAGDQVVDPQAQFCKFCGASLADSGSHPRAASANGNPAEKPIAPPTPTQ